MDDASLLTARQLACERGGRPVFAGVDLDVAPGRLILIEGPNGAGKSSLLRLLAGLLAPSGGNLSRRSGLQLHYLGHRDGLKDTLTLHENLMRWHAAYRMRGDIADACRRVGLGHALDLPGRVFSAGQRRRAALAMLLLAPRPLWLLDEPTSTIDAEGEALLGDLMRAHLDGGGAIVAATHRPLPLPEDAKLTFARKV